MTLHLTQSWSPAPQGTKGSFHFCLTNLGGAAIQIAKFCYTSLGRIDESSVVTGGTVARNYGSYVEIVPDNGRLDLEQTWELKLVGLVYGASNRSQGVITAWVETETGETLDITIEDLLPEHDTPGGAGKDWPAGNAETPLGLLPWPQDAQIDAWHDDLPRLYPAPGSDLRPFLQIARLHQRLFPTAPTVIGIQPATGGTAIRATMDTTLPAEGYRLVFGDEIDLAYSTPDGLRHGLIALTQMAHSAATDRRYLFPRAGVITDAPRFEWRGLMFDVARNFFPVDVNLRLMDIMAWLRMNRLHWHLTDDEGWRIPSKAFPTLGTIGATRAQGAPMPPQYGDGPNGQSGAYSAEDIATVLDHGRALGITVIPEVEMPGHAASLLASVPGLADPEEPACSYRSIQGFTNNALNPGIARSYDVAETLLDEAAELFPCDIVHVGADEVDLSAWAQSPAAQRFAKEHGLSTTHELQAWFLRHVQAHLKKSGRRIGAWDEAAEGGGIDPDGAVMFAWRTKEKTAELIEKGYDVVATPGQAYYLDMVESEGWNARGISWAGVSTPSASYAHDVSAGLPQGPGRLLGVQAGIWCEYLHDVQRINAIAFPRLAIVAEAGWTPAESKSAPRFFALSHMVPQL
ncbi:beta-N-acetylhexosaminidase [Paracoccus sp. Z330]|uniref:beta-N-acetylhexosaminidase n=1 Tax=Paracoccus onchidii TaxID=3017813 RepID=A0ABT4ZG68_9RHOB|nr:beta-N-acetylhexosaminidase [Paracoccus onchidii]MDB6178264.1 beta-N-acetylhexosaminidase [Paracoccus onchidii]